MKKLGKLSISPDKIMKNEELINLQGGYLSCDCIFWWYTGETTEIGGLCGTSSTCEQCAVDVAEYYNGVYAAFCF